MLDAFRPDYLPRTKFLYNLSKYSVVGTLEETFGFIPRPAYFGGLTPNDYGFSNMFKYNKNEKPFISSKYIHNNRFINESTKRYFILQNSKEYLTNFEAAYADTLNIPLKYLHHFSLSEKYHPASKYCNYKSTYHILDERGLKWYDNSWPLYNGRTNPTDGFILSEALKAIDGTQDFSFLHFSSLDSIGHTYGPGSYQIHSQLKIIDDICMYLHSHIASIYESFDIVFFGDHGMLQVIDHIDIIPKLEGFKNSINSNFIYFVDSTMIRFWTNSIEEKKLLIDFLNKSKDGFVLDEDKRKQYSIDKLDRSNGEIYFMAYPGVIFHPNFFQSSNGIPLGMHGLPAKYL